jgi:hypothetical protein
MLVRLLKRGALLPICKNLGISVCLNDLLD